MSGIYFMYSNSCAARGKPTDAKIILAIGCAESARILCNTDSVDAEFFIHRTRGLFKLYPQSIEEQVKASRLAGEKFKFVSKKRLQNFLTKKVKDVFGSQYEECQVDEGHWTAFDVKCGNWMLTTQFTFGRAAKRAWILAEHLQSERENAASCDA